MRALLARWAAAERGDIVIGWLTRIIVAVALFGVVAFDGISVAVGAVGAADDADTAAVAARDAWQQSHDLQKAYDAAVTSLSDKPDDSIPTSSFSIDPTGTVTLKVRRETTTLLMHHIGPLRHLTVVVESGSASPGDS